MIRRVIATLILLFTLNTYSQTIDILLQGYKAEFLEEAAKRGVDGELYFKDLKSLRLAILPEGQVGGYQNDSVFMNVSYILTHKKFRHTFYHEIGHHVKLDHCHTDEIVACNHIMSTFIPYDILAIPEHEWQLRLDYFFFNSRIN